MRAAARRSRPERPFAAAWLRYGAVLVLIPLLALACIEGALRLAGYGAPASFFVRRAWEGRELYGANPLVGRRFFPSPLAREPLPESFAAQKSPESLRIFVFGESAAMGEAYWDFSFSRQLEAMLRAHDPDGRIEVVNMSLTAVDSSAVREFVEEAARYDPDLFIIFCGNNELIGPGSARAAAGHSVLRRTQAALRTLRVGQLAVEAAEALHMRRSGRGARSWKGMSLFLEHKIPPGDPQIDAALRSFEENLRAMKAVAAARKVPMVLCTVPANLRDCPPFASLHRAELPPEALRAWEARVAVGADLSRRGDSAGALAQFVAADAIDDGYAELAFRIARCHETLDETGKAQQRYAQARELDVLRFRPPGALNGVVRACAAGSPGVSLADVERDFREASHCGAPGADLLFDHVHLTPEGHHRVASLLLRVILEKRLWRGARSAASSPPLTLPACLDRLGCAPLDGYRALEYVLDRIIARPPFTLQLDHSAQMKAGRERLSRLAPAGEDPLRRQALAQYRKALQRSSDSAALRTRLAAVCAELQRYDEAYALYAALLAAQPAASATYASAGDVCGALSRYDEGIAWYTKAIDCAPFVAPLYLCRGTLRGKKGDSAGALTDFRRAASLDPRLAPAYHSQGIVLTKQKRPGKAIEAFTRAIELDGRYGESYYFRGVLRAQLGDLRGALDDVERAASLRYPVDAGLLERLRTDAK